MLSLLATNVRTHIACFSGGVEPGPLMPPPGSRTEQTLGAQGFLHKVVERIHFKTSDKTLETLDGSRIYLYKKVTRIENTNLR